jgi:hypothetical protein
MGQIFKVTILSIFLFSLASCSSISQSKEDESYRIDYYSGGGFTGMESGVTIFSDGNVKFWKKRLNSERQITDSLKLSEEQITKLNEISKNPELFTFSNKYTGNYTTYLLLTKGIQLNHISFNGAELPAEMPDCLKNLISEIKIILKNKGA